jgi:ABC-type amino acid transport system permease subunit
VAQFIKQDKARLTCQSQRVFSTWIQVLVFYLIFCLIESCLTKVKSD